jgi:hypothetical protein
MIKKFRSNLCFMVWWLKFEQENTDDHWVIFLLNDDCSSWVKFCSFILPCSKANIKDLILLSGLLLTSVFMLRKKTVSPKHTPAYWKKMLHSRKGPFILRYKQSVWLTQFSEHTHFFDISVFKWKMIRKGNRGNSFVQKGGSFLSKISPPLYLAVWCKV